MGPIRHLLQPLKRLPSDTRGATAVEYGLIAALVVIAMMVALKSVAAETVLLWTNVATVVVTTGVR